MLSDPVAEAFGLIHRHPSGENFWRAEQSAFFIAQPSTRRVTVFPAKLQKILGGLVTKVSQQPPSDRPSDIRSGGFSMEKKLLYLSICPVILVDFG